MIAIAMQENKCASRFLILKECGKENGKWRRAECPRHSGPGILRGAFLNPSAWATTRL